MKRALSLLSLVVMSSLGCQAPADDDAVDSESAVREGDYAFGFTDGREDLERLDTMGVPLLGTILANKDRSLKGERLMQLASGRTTPDPDESAFEAFIRGARSRVAQEIVTPYRASAPYVGTPYLLALFDANFMKLHARWRDSLIASGYPVCSKDLGIATPVAPCTVQEAIDEDGRELGKVAQILVPDWLTVDVTVAPRFPNGRTPDDPVGDTILALGFLKMGAPCPDGKPCNARTFANLKHADGSIGTNPPKNDRNTYRAFPYLATPWFYWNDGDRPYVRDEQLRADDCDAEGSEAGRCPYWPKGERKRTPGPPGTRYAAPSPSDPVALTPAPRQR
ncbi:MAG: hypothetical protein JST00_18340 [Deltaproteobacteria bacterium]|nr:hypothetical protein [Deltaproteobacteria bacterium]